MYEVITNHARDNVWCAPLQDYEHLVKPSRLSGPGGWYRYCGKITWIEDLPLPHIEDPRFKNRFHVYQIGQYPDWLLGVPDLEDKWVNLNKITEDTDCFVHCFIDNGVVLKATECWLRILKPSNNIVLAVEIDHSYDLGTMWAVDPITGAQVEGKVKLDFKELFIRFYSNARLFTLAQRDKVKNPHDQVRGYTKFCGTPQDVTKFIADTDDPNRPKFGWMRMGGFVVSREFMRANVSLGVGKFLYAYHDDTVLTKTFHKYTTLRQFESKKNRGKHKFVMFFGRDQKETIFYNDVEYFIGVKRADQFYGVYIPKFTGTEVGMITHAIHCLSTDTVEDIIANNFNWMTNPEEFYIMTVVRQGGMVRGLTHQHSRIEELYRLDEEQILQALTDRNSVLPEWRAENLEVDAYAELMSVPELKDITPELVVKAYGYNALTKYMQPQVVKTKPLEGVPGYRCAEVACAFVNPDGVPDRYLPLEVVEYDNNGKMIGVSKHGFSYNGLLYFKDPTPNTYVDKIEYYYIKYQPEDDYALVDRFDLVIQDAFLASHGFACYVCPIVNGRPNFNWTNVTGSDYYSYTTRDAISGYDIPTIRWNESELTADDVQCMVRIPNESGWKHGTYKDILVGDNEYGIVTCGKQWNGWDTMIPGQIDVWVDGDLLHEDLDYIVKWPSIYIFKKLPDYDVSYSVRIGGLPNPTTKKNWKPAEFGFVRDGKVSVDKVWDPRDDRNKQITIGGKLQHESEVSFAEDETPGVAKHEGLPYTLTDYITPIEFYSGHNALVEKARSMEMDKRVSEYLTLHLGTKPPVNPFVIKRRWHVVSVFYNAILTELRNGWLKNELEGEWNNVDMEEWLKPFMSLLDVDVSRSDFFNPEYVEILPHGKQVSVEVTSAQLNFLRFVNEDYMNGVIEIEKYIYIEIG